MTNRARELAWQLGERLAHEQATLIGLVADVEQDAAGAPVLARSLQVRWYAVSLGLSAYAMSTQNVAE